ncbi:MAG: FeoA family protein [bacterium]
MGLDTIQPGRICRIHSISDASLRHQFIRFGLTEGSEITVAARIPFGPYILRAGRQELAIGRKLARSIRVTSSPSPATTAAEVAVELV